MLAAVGAAAVMAIMAGLWMWSQKPDYKVLFSNFSDKDGGAIVASLQQLNIPYKYADGGVAILVPAEQVHDVRLKLAAQGLPKGGGVGFELMENQKLGVSQFHEQVNFQRALEGEMARSIQSISAVQTARVHLAMPKNTVFVREQQKPTASVLLNLHPGRSLDQQQVSAIVHLVASSVPDLPAKNVTVVDQDGNLLSNTDKQANANTLDATQLKYVQELQQGIARRIESIITPIVGANNVRAEATADVDFSRVEQAAETYKPNGTPDNASIRSQQSSEATGPGSAGAAGVPGAMSNQPQASATAPVNGQPALPAAAPAAAVPAANVRKDSTVNYEVDKTIRYTQQPMGGVRRLSVAVVLNYRTEMGKNGKPETRALTEAEKGQITDLIKEAMGFNKERGDSLNVLNSPFVTPEKLPYVEPVMWKNPEYIALAKDGGRYLLLAVVLLYLFFAVLRPMLKKITPPAAQTPALAGAAGAPALGNETDEDGAVVKLSSGELPAPKARNYQENLEAAKALARQDPRMVANIVKSWVDGNE
ncbi:MAG: flagellar basal-body MS-ring/collar protein FliF [Noviherbaspirillum sp.]